MSAGRITMAAGAPMIVFSAARVVLVGGAVLATITDRRLGGTVAPLALGYLLYSTIAYCCQLLALRRPVDPADAVIPG